MQSVGVAPSARPRSRRGDMPLPDLARAVSVSIDAAPVGNAEVVLIGDDLAGQPDQWDAVLCVARKPTYPSCGAASTPSRYAIGLVESWPTIDPGLLRMPSAAAPATIRSKNTPEGTMRHSPRVVEVGSLTHNGQTVPGRPVRL